MSQQLLQFSGNDLQVKGEPEMIDTNKVRVILEAPQPDQVLSNIKNATHETIIMIRRMLSQGMTLDIESIHAGKKILTVDAIITDEANEAHISMLPLIQENAYIAKPHHYNGRTPLTANQIRFAASQSFLHLNRGMHDQLAELEENETVLPIDALAGSLNYYPEILGEQHGAMRAEFLRNRMMMRPGDIDEHSQPVWKLEHELVAPGTNVSMQIRGLRTHFHAVMLHGKDVRRSRIIEQPVANITIADRNVTGMPQIHSRAFARIYDQRKPDMVRPYATEQRAEVLLRDKNRVMKVFDRLAEVALHKRNERPTVLLQNINGIRRFLSSNQKQPFIKTVSDMQPTIQSPYSSLTPESNPLAQEAAQAPELALIEHAERFGMDSGGVLVCETFPQHASLDALIGNDARHKGNYRPFTQLLFRHAGLRDRHFSKHDYTSLYNSASNNMRVSWYHDDIAAHPEGEKGTILDLVRHEQRGKGSGSLMFVPQHKMEEYRNGLHVAFYGTARTLTPEYIAFMEGLFKQLDNDQAERKYVVHSGGGPNTSTMGVANKLAYERGWLSAGHTLHVSKEPANDYVNCTFPFRAHDRDVRQGNMANACDVFVALEGGGGTREERGIALTDLAIARVNPFPLVLVGKEFYHYELLQYFHEVKVGTMDPRVLECVSLIELDNPEKLAEIIKHYRDAGEVMSYVPGHYRPMRSEALAAYLPMKKFRESAWHEKKR